MFDYKGKAHKWKDTLHSQISQIHQRKHRCACLCNTNAKQWSDAHTNHQPCLFLQVFHCSVHIYALVGFNTTKLCLWEFEMVSSCRLPHFLMFSVVSSITAVWSRMCASSHSYNSAIHYSALTNGQTLLPTPTEEGTSHFNHNGDAQPCCARLIIYVITCTLCSFHVLVMQGFVLIFKATNRWHISPHSCAATVLWKVLTNKNANTLYWALGIMCKRQHCCNSNFAFIFSRAQKTHAFIKSMHIHRIIFFKNVSSQILQCYSTFCFLSKVLHFSFSQVSLPKNKTKSSWLLRVS